VNTTFPFSLGADAISLREDKELIEAAEGVDNASIESNATSRLVAGTPNDCPDCSDESRMFAVDFLAVAPSSLAAWDSDASEVRVLTTELLSGFSL
jgi:hypothetical protein